MVIPAGRTRWRQHRPTAQLPGEAHDTELSAARPPAYRATGPGTSITVPHEPAAQRCEPTVCAAAGCPHHASAPAGAKKVHQVTPLFMRSAPFRAQARAALSPKAPRAVSIQTDAVGTRMLHETTE